MRILTYFDWWGTDEELAKLDQDMKKMSEEVDGVEFLGRWAVHTRKYHWVRMWEAESYLKWLNPPRPNPRDKKKMSHVVIEIWT